MVTFWSFNLSHFFDAPEKKTFFHDMHSQRCFYYHSARSEKILVSPIYWLKTAITQSKQCPNKKNISRISYLIV